MGLNVTEIVTATMVLFAVIDIIGSIPIILDIKKKAGRYTRKGHFGGHVHHVCLSHCGRKLITFIGIDVNSFAVAGSFVLFALAMEMILGIHLFRDDGTPQRWRPLFPGVSIIAGAGSMTSILSLRAV